ncbi:hypothetical protein [Microbacterium excoecariae]|uniref:hypothetical protein n=1 Tax=Microbacterium excoecariae TaxID=2715210 RepID=UPI001407AC2F|nr:hypothetical protein [Microbacterium excoecariae]NHI16849.1 hypothetical protein [Microbacterium excoecariae]
MRQGQRLQLSPDELTDDDMLMMSSQVRFLAIVLRWRAMPSGEARLMLPALKGMFFPVDPYVTTDTLTTDVMELESIGFLRTFVGGDGLEYYRIARPVEGETATGEDPPPASHGPFIGSVGREKRESAREREGERREGRPRAQLNDPGPPPARFCPDHASTGGSAGEPCVRCRDARMEFMAWNYNRTSWMAARNAPRFEEDSDD